MPTPTLPPAIPPKAPGLFLSFVLMGVLVGLLAAALNAGIQAGPGQPGPGQPGPGSVLLGLYIMAWGCMFLAGYYFSHKSVFLRCLMWVCEHASSPASRKMAVFYFALGIGTMVLLAGLGMT